MVSEVHFGSRMADEWDRRIMQVYAERLFADDGQTTPPTEWFTGICFLYPVLVFKRALSSYECFETGQHGYFYAVF
jgi:hypothetical protein